MRLSIWLLGEKEFYLPSVGKIVGIPIVCWLECVFISVIVVPTVLDNGCCVTHRHCIPGNTADIYIQHFSIQSVTVNYN